MAQQVLKNIYRLPIQLEGSPLKVLNAYLITGGGRSLLIDTGYRMPSCRKDLFEQLAQFGLGPGDVDVFLTHMHSDHSGLAAEAAGSGGTIYISRQDGWIFGSDEQVGQFRIQNNARMRSEGMPEDVIEEMFPSGTSRLAQELRETRHVYLEDGDELQAGGYRLKCVLTPGHTPGHLCLWLEEHKTMFLGDHVLFDISPNITFWPGVEDALGQYLQSLRATLAYDAALALPAHRGGGELQPRIERLLQHHDERLQEAWEIVRQTPGICAYQVAARLRWRIRANSWQEFPVAQKWFATGETVAHLDHLVKQGRLCRREENGIGRYEVV